MTSFIKLVPGHRVWGGERDSEGHRTYNVTHLVECSVDYGPARVMLCPGLPVIGAKWRFKNDRDDWAFCTPERKVIVHETKEGHPTTTWRVDDTFTTKPGRRCQDTSIENPLLEPANISGSFVKYTKEATHDWQGNPIQSSSHEPLKGPQLEFDESRMTVKIEQNTLSLQFWLLANFMNMLNDQPLWGMPKRCIKVDGISWQRKLYGRCHFYYTRSLDFDINFETFDREVPDEGTKVLHGHWRYHKKGDPDAPDKPPASRSNAWILDTIDGEVPNRQNPAHFDRFKDRNGELAKTYLNGYGLPAEVFVQDPLGTGTSAADDGTGIFIPDGTGADEADGIGSGLVHRTKAAKIKVKKYREGNLLLLGVPTSF